VGAVTNFLLSTTDVVLDLGTFTLSKLKQGARH
jgi:hypothetical protein